LNLRPVHVHDVIVQRQLYVHPEIGATLSTSTDRRPATWYLDAIEQAERYAPEYSDTAGARRVLRPPLVADRRDDVTRRG
jgi:hypothetical protein